MTRSPRSTTRHEGEMWAFVGARDRYGPDSSSGTRGRSRFAPEHTRSSTGSQCVLASRVGGHESGPPLQPARRSARAQLSGERHRDCQRALRSGSVGAGPTVGRADPLRGHSGLGPPRQVLELPGGRSTSEADDAGALRGGYDARAASFRSSRGSARRVQHRGGCTEVPPRLAGFARVRASAWVTCGADD